MKNSASTAIICTFLTVMGTVLVAFMQSNHKETISEIHPHKALLDTLAKHDSLFYVDYLAIHNKK